MDTRLSEGRDAPALAPFWLPHHAPLDMPEQPLGRRRVEAERVSQADVETRPCAQWRCAAVIGGAAFLTAAFARALYLVLSVNGVTPLQIVFLILSSLAFSWVALGAASAIAGMAALLLGGTPPLSPARRVVGRTALLFPIYHEPPARIAGSIEAMCEDLERLGLADGFDLFVLSDSRNRDVGEQEAAIFRRLAQRLRDRMPLFYRRRPENRGRKAGNIADWVSRFGASYETFVVLDAAHLLACQCLLVHGTPPRKSCECSSTARGIQRGTAQNSSRARRPGGA